MNKKFSYLLFWVILTSAVQSCAAGEIKINTNQASPSQTAESQTSKIPTPGTRDAAYASSRYKPRNLIVSLDFEDEEVKPVKGNKVYDMLEFRTPTGEASAVGIYYEGGNAADRGARISADPKDESNRVMHYWLKNARVSGQKKGLYKGRIQVDLADVNRTSVFQRFRLYLHPDLDFYRQYPKGSGWFTINEFWMGAKWKRHPYPFRITLNIGKPVGAGTDLYFTVGAGVAAGGAIGKGDWKNVWGKAGLNFKIPLGEWLDVEIGYKQGDKKTGRFYMGVKREKDKQFTTIIDKRNWTYHPESPEPVPLTNWNPIKIYTSSKIIDFVRKKSGVTQIFWDDLEIYADW